MKRPILYHLSKWRTGVYVLQEGEPHPFTTWEVSEAVRQTIRRELRYGNNPYLIAKGLSDSLHQDYGKNCSSIPEPETKTAMKHPENIDDLTDWIMAREEMTQALALLNGAMPDKDNPNREIFAGKVTSPGEVLLEDLLWGLIPAEGDWQ